jgi:hypothetical protein
MADLDVTQPNKGLRVKVPDDNTHVSLIVPEEYSVTVFGVPFKP